MTLSPNSRSMGEFLYPCEVQSILSRRDFVKYLINEDNPVSDTTSVYGFDSRHSAEDFKEGVLVDLGESREFFDVNYSDSDQEWDGSSTLDFVSQRRRLAEASI
ncbi:hypothetical protein HN747_00650 [archaeon]|jgi:hypothetical protein|nr:hypothetical protein [archaeon]